MQPTLCLLPLLVVMTVILPSPAVYAQNCPEGSQEQLQRQLHTLLESINRHNELYEVGMPEVSDQEYDALTQRQRLIERCLHLPQSILPPPLTQQHRAPLGSLTKAEDPEDIEAFMNSALRLGSPVILQPKIDGIAIELVYQNGRLVQALTRGQRRTGGSGINLLPFIDGISAIPPTLPNNHHEIVLHGELYTLADNPHAQQAASPRHYVAGLVNRATPEPEQLKALKFFPWHWVNSPLASLQGNTREFNRWGFQVEQYTHTVKDMDTVARLRNSYQRKQNMGELPMDGVVLKLDNIAIQHRLGTLDGTPYWAVAWKFPSATRATSVTDIIWTIGRTGQVSVILELEPVAINGVLISRVHVGPEEYFSTLDIARHDTVAVALKGSATPVLGQVLSRLDRRKSVQVPRQNQFNGLTCLRYAPTCEQQFLARVAWLIGPNGLNLPGVKRTDLEQLVARGKIRTLSDIYTLSETDLPQETITALNNTRLPLARALTALGIPGIGQKKAAKLARHGGSWNSIERAAPAQLKSWLNCSEESAQKVRTYLDTQEIIDLTRQLFR